MLSCVSTTIDLTNEAAQLVEVVRKSLTELSEFEKNVNAMDLFCNWVARKDPAFAADIRELYLEYRAAQQPHSGDGAVPSGAEGQSLSGDSSGAPGLNNPPRA